MALPTIQHDHQVAGVGSNTVLEVMPRMHTMFLAAGWTIEYADTDAIGAGSAATPAWDKTPAANAVAGVVVYRMPANGFTTQWYVRIEAFWSSSANGWAWRLQAGAGHSAGTISNGITSNISVIAVNTTDAFEWAASVSEDGFAYVPYGSSANSMYAVERARLPDGSVTDELCVLVNRNSSSSQYCAVIDPTDYLVHPSSTNVIYGLAGYNGTTTLSGSALGATNTSFATRGRDGLTSTICGPFMVTSKGIGAPFRLFIGVIAHSAAQASLIPVTVDGGTKLYRTGDVASNVSQFTTLLSSSWVAVATE